jgi:magnesium transporter
MEKPTKNPISVGKSIVIKTKNPTVLRVLDYTKSGVIDRKLTNVKECFKFKNKASVSWINITGTPDTNFLNSLAKHFKLHHLTLGDLSNLEHRPKFENLEDYLFLILKLVYYDEIKKEVRTQQVGIILGQKFVLCFQEKETDVFNKIIKRIKDSNDRIRRNSTDYLVYELVDSVINNYFIVLEKLEDDLERIEKEVLQDPNEHTS